MHVGTVVLELWGCRVALVFLIPSLRCLFVGTHMLFHRSPGIYSMTYSLLLFLCGGVSVPSLRLLSGLSFLVAFRVVCGGAVGRGSSHPTDDVVRHKRARVNKNGKSTVSKTVLTCNVCRRPDTTPRHAGSKSRTKSKRRRRRKLTLNTSSKLRKTLPLLRRCISPGSVFSS